MEKFLNREDAGNQLAQQLSHLKKEKGIVLAIPRGGVPVGYQIAVQLKWSLEIFPVKKFPHPLNPELAIGAVTMEDYLLNEPVEVSSVYIETTLQNIRTRLKEMKDKFHSPPDYFSLKGKTVLVTDDGVATGNTILFCLQMLQKQKPARLIVAIPVVSPSALEKIKLLANEVVALKTPEHFTGISMFYEDFQQLTDEAVMEYLSRFHHRCNQPDFFLRNNVTLHTKQSLCVYNPNSKDS